MTKVVTFYSYKGGVGRTMALVNVAHVLARDGRRVLMVDFDLEAPGMTHFFEDQVRHRPSQVQYDAVDLLLHAKASYEAAKTAGKPPEFPRSLAEYVVPIHLPRKWLQEAPAGIPYLNGRLDLLPATLEPPGDSPEEGLSRDYLNRLDELDLARIFGPEGPGHFLGDHVRQYFVHARFEAPGDILFTMRETVQAAYDIVLVDSRTGLNEISGLCIGPLCDSLVLCCGLNRQNIEGTRYFAERSGLLNRGEGKPYLVVGGPVPPWLSRSSQGRISVMRKLLRVRKVFEIPYNPVAAVEETVFVVKEPGEFIAYAYEELAPATADISRGEEHESKALRSAIYRACEYPVKDSASLLKALARRLGLMRLNADSWSRLVPQGLDLFPSAVTLALLSRTRRRTEPTEFMQAIGFGVAVAASRLQSDSPFVRFYEVLSKFSDGHQLEGWMHVLEFFRVRTLQKSSEAWRAMAGSRISSKTSVKRAYPEWQYIFNANLTALNACNLDVPEYITENWEIFHRNLRRVVKSRGIFSQSPFWARSVSSLSLSLGDWESWWEKSHLDLFLILGKKVLGEGDAEKLSNVLREAPVSLVDALSQYGDIWSFWVLPELAEAENWNFPGWSPRSFDPLGLWPEPLMAAAVARAKGHEGIQEVLAWIALARMTYGYAWRVLVDWRHLERVKDHPLFQAFLKEEDELVEDIESAIDQGIYTL